jgi:hypothetical protein
MATVNLLHPTNSTVKMNEAGDICLNHFSGSSITLDALGNIILKTASANLIFTLTNATNTATMIQTTTGAYLTLDTSGNWFIKGTTIQLNPV